jgi:hypothetical protein
MCSTVSRMATCRRALCSNSCRLEDALPR